MKIDSLYKISVYDLTRNKMNIIFFILLVILNVLIFVGLSYHSSLFSFWNAKTKNSADFNTLWVKSNIDVDKLRNNEHVLDVYSFDEYLSWGTLSDFFIDDNQVSISLNGTIPKTKKIISGSDLSENNYEMICPSELVNFNTKDFVFDKNKVLNLESYVGKNIDIKLLNEFDVSLKLVGVFDRTFDYSMPDSCYVNHATLMEINSKYDTRKKDIDGKFILLDDISNAGKILNGFDNIEYVPIVAIDTEAGDNIIKLTSILSLILIVISIIFCYALSSRRINKERKNIGIFKICGFKENTIKKIFLYENVMIALVSLIVSMVLSYFIALNIPKWFLARDPMLYIMKVTLSPVVILIGAFITLVSLILSTNMALKEIDNLDVGEIIYD